MLNVKCNFIRLWNVAHQWSLVIARAKTRLFIDSNDNKLVNRFRIRDLLNHVGLLGDTTVNTTIHQTFPAHRIRGREIDVRWLLQERYFQVKLLRYALWWRVGVSWPDDVLDVQTFLLPGLPHADLLAQMRRETVKSEGFSRFDKWINVDTGVERFPQCNVHFSCVIRTTARYFCYLARCQKRISFFNCFWLI